jgi:putative SOS response-associated peptidase YedK
VVADGFYVRQRTDGRKQSYFAGTINDHRFGPAGLWERRDKGDEPGPWPRGTPARVRPVTPGGNGTFRALRRL